MVIAIIAILAGFAYRGLTALLESREQLRQESRKWRDAALFVGRIERDLRAILDRPVRPGALAVRRLEEGTRMRGVLVGGLVAAVLLAGCAGRAPEQGSQESGAKKPAANVLESVHLRLEVNPEDGAVTYLGWYDGRRNLLGPHGMVAGLVGMEPAQMQGKLGKNGENELRFEGTDHERSVAPALDRTVRAANTHGPDRRRNGRAGGGTVGGS